MGLQRCCFYSLLREIGSLTSRFGSRDWFRIEKFLFALTRDRVTDTSAPAPQPSTSSCFYSLLREIGSLTRGL